MKMKNYIKLLRPKHYIKNVLVFLPILFACQIFNLKLLAASFFGFLAFSFASSLVYIINDINDAPKDRLHPIKKNRPIASGAVSIPKAIILAVMVSATVLVCHFLAVRSMNLPALIVLLTYIVMNFLYSIGLKNKPIIDITILALGFLLRLLYGSMITGIQASVWLYLTVIMFSFYMGLGKRRNEFSKTNDSATRKVLEHYSYNFLDKNMYMCMSLTLMFYSLWTVDSATVARVGSTNLIWTVPIVIVICMKYNLSIEGDSYGDPVDALLADKVLIFLVLVYCAVTFSIIYAQYLLALIR